MIWHSHSSSWISCGCKRWKSIGVTTSVLRFYVFQRHSVNTILLVGVSYLLSSFYSRVEIMRSCRLSALWVCLPTNDKGMKCLQFVTQVCMLKKERRRNEMKLKKKKKEELIVAVFKPLTMTTAKIGKE